jgi:hypothetical protein
MVLFKYIIAPAIVGFTLIIGKNLLEMRKSLRSQVNSLEDRINKLTDFVVGTEPHPPDYFPKTLGLAGRMSILEEQQKEILAILSRVEKKM